MGLEAITKGVTQLPLARSLSLASFHCGVSRVRCSLACVSRDRSVSFWSKKEALVGLLFLVPRLLSLCKSLCTFDVLCLYVLKIKRIVDIRWMTPNFPGSIRGFLIRGLGMIDACVVIEMQYWFCYRYLVMFRTIVISCGSY